MFIKGFNRRALIQLNNKGNNFENINWILIE